MSGEFDEFPDMPDELVGLVPEIGSVWVWEPLKSHAREYIRVIGVVWNGEEAWITSENVEHHSAAWNTLDRWMEAAVLLSSADEADARMAAAGDR